MAQINLLQGLIGPDLLGQRRHLLLGKHILGQVDLAQGEDREQLCDSITRKLVVIEVDVLEVGAILDSLDQDFDALIIDFVIC